MGVLGISLIVASVVYVFFGPSQWLPPWVPHWRGFSGSRRVIGDAPATSPSDAGSTENSPDGHQSGRAATEAPSIKKSENQSAATTAMEKPNDPPASSVVERKKTNDKIVMPPPPLPAVSSTPPTIQEPASGEEATTPKATATVTTQPVPSFTLSEDSATTPSAPRPGSMMPPALPPPRVSASPAAPGRLPPTAGRLPQFPAANSAQRARGPAPDRSPQAPSSSGLALPPTHSSKPSKPSRKVLLTPGHSPLDWARISGPNADLRGVPSSSSYLRVTPSMLKKQTGRKGKDAWMALNGKVYNVTPYADFHPGGVPELMRGAGRDGTKLFGEIHPWVNYETMLSACLVGLLVDEAEGNQESEMDKMD